MRHSILPLFLFAAAFSASAQIVSFGVKAGAPITLAAFEQGDTGKTGRWTVGPTVEFHVTSALSVEIDALYRGYHVNGGGAFLLAPPSNTLIYSFHDEVKTWDFPLLLKYR